MGSTFLRCFLGSWRFSISTALCPNHNLSLSVLGCIFAFYLNISFLLAPFVQTWFFWTNVCNWRFSSALHKLCTQIRVDTFRQNSLRFSVYLYYIIFSFFFQFRYSLEELFFCGHCVWKFFPSTKCQMLLAGCGLCKGFLINFRPSSYSLSNYTFILCEKLFMAVQKWWSNPSPFLYTSEDDYVLWLYSTLCLQFCWQFAISVDSVVVFETHKFENAFSQIVALLLVSDK